MPLLLKSFAPEQDQPDRSFPELDARLSRVQAASGVRLTLIHPRGAAERGCRYVGLLRVRTGTGSTARGHAQIVATGERILGLIMAGDLVGPGERRGRPISEADGVLVAFNVDRAELAGPQVEPHGAGGAARAAFHGRAEDPFVLEIEAIVARLTDAGGGAGAGLPDFLLDMTLAGVVALQQLATEVAVALR